MHWWIYMGQQINDTFDKQNGSLCWSSPPPPNTGWMNWVRKRVFFLSWTAPLASLLEVCSDSFIVDRPGYCPRLKNRANKEQTPYARCKIGIIVRAERPNKLYSSLDKLSISNTCFSLPLFFPTQAIWPKRKISWNCQLPYAAFT